MVNRVERVVSDGVWEWWSDGVMEWWSDGVLEWWKQVQYSNVTTQVIRLKAEDWNTCSSLEHPCGNPINQYCYFVSHLKCFKFNMITYNLWLNPDFSKKLLRFAKHRWIMCRPLRGLHSVWTKTSNHIDFVIARNEVTKQSHNKLNRLLCRPSSQWPGFWGFRSNTTYAHATDLL
jgi:hypothetical protein